MTSTGPERWVVADSAWWGRDRWSGRCALRLLPAAPRGTGPSPAPPEDHAAGGPVDVGQVPPGAAVRAVPGTLLPGLVDAHVHTGLVDVRALRDGGIAACQDLGGVPDAVARLRGLSRTPGSGLPLVDVAGAILTAPGGYPADRSWAAPGSWREVTGAADAGQAVAEQAAAGASCVKVAVHVDAGPVLAPAVLAAVVRAAHALGLPVVVHAEGDGAAAAALDAGADRLAHTPWTERLDRGLLRDLAARTTWISTLDIHGWGTPTRELDTALDNLRRFLADGGHVLYGTDLGNGPLPPGVNAREVRALQRAGLSPDDVLVAMTGTPDGPGPAPACCWVPGGLDRDPGRFAAALATARVLEDVAGAGGPG